MDEKIPGLRDALRKVCTTSPEELEAAIEEVASSLEAAVDRIADSLTAHLTYMGADEKDMIQRIYEAHLDPSSNRGPGKHRHVLPNQR